MHIGTIMTYGGIQRVFDLSIIKKNFDYVPSDAKVKVE